MMQSLNARASSLSLSQTSSDIQYGDRNMALLRTDIADCWLRNKYSAQTYYYKVGTSSNTLKCHIISAGLWLRLFIDQSVYFYISKCSWNYKPNGVCQRAFSHPVYVSYGKIVTSQCSQ